MTTPASQSKVALVIGAGDSTGGAIAKRFAKEGFIACVTRRSADKLQPLVDSIHAEGGQAFGYASDARKEDDVAALFTQIEAEHGPIEVMVFNIGANVPCSILEETARKYFKIWEMACLSGFLNAQQAARRMGAPFGRGLRPEQSRCVGRYGQGIQVHQPGGHRPGRQAQVPGRLLHLCDGAGLQHQGDQARE